MLSYIEKLRQAPMSQRRRVAALVTVVVVGVIALIWVLSLTFRFVGPFNTNQQTITPENSGIEAPY